MNEKIYKVLFTELLAKSRGNVSEKEANELYEQAQKIRIENKGNEKVIREKLQTLLTQKKTVQLDASKLFSSEELKVEKKYKYISYSYIAFAALIIFSLIQFKASEVIFPLAVISFFVGMVLPKITKGKLQYGIYDTYCSVFGGMFFIGIAGILFITGSSVSFFNYPFWLWILSGIIATLLTFFISKSIEFQGKEISFHKLKSYGFLVFYYALFFATTFGIFLSINVVYDYSEVELHKPIINDKTVETAYDEDGHEDGDAFYFIVEKWHPDSDIVSMGVSEETYNKSNIGDTFTIYEKKGLLGIPYWTIYERQIK